MLKRITKLATHLASDPFLAGMVGLYLLGRSLAGISEQATQMAARLGELQVAAATTMNDAAAVAVQVDGMGAREAMARMNGQPAEVDQDQPERAAP